MSQNGAPYTIVLIPGDGIGPEVTQLGYLANWREEVT